jgi:hypothetical protein
MSSWRRKPWKWCYIPEADGEANTFVDGVPVRRPGTAVSDTAITNVVSLRLEERSEEPIRYFEVKYNEGFLSKIESVVACVCTRCMSVASSSLSVEC